MKKALITGIAGQDGSYLAEFLLEKKYQVFGIARDESERASLFQAHQFSASPDSIRIFTFDLREKNSLEKILTEVRPNEIYSLAAQSRVGESIEKPIETLEVNALVPTTILEFVRRQKTSSRIFQAASAEIFGQTSQSPQNETTELSPLNPYACSKALAFSMVKYYRKSHDIFATNGILYNHESPRRPLSFVTRKITSGIAQILSKKIEGFGLGNLSAKRDWGHAKDFVKAMWLSLQSSQGDDFIFASGLTHSIEEFLKAAFDLVDLDWRDFVNLDSSLIRPQDILEMRGDASKAARELHWKPTIGFEEIVREMLEADLVREGLDPLRWIRS